MIQQITDAEQAAAKAHQQNDFGRVKDLAKSAQAACEQLTKKASTNDSAELKARLVTAQATAQRVRELGATADEEQQRLEKVGSLKFKTYKKSRELVLSVTLPLLANSAAKAAGGKELSAIERPLADQAWNLARVVGQQPPLAAGAPDWNATALLLRRWSTNPPMAFRAFAGLTWVLQGRPDLALVEFETVEPASLTTPPELQLFHAGRAVVYTMQGWDRLAAPEIDQFAALSNSTNGFGSGGELLAIFHALLAYHHGIENRDFGKMDAEIAKCVKAWPANPLVVFLTGERLAANGEWEKAAVSLESQLAGTGDEWLAQRYAQRARDLRDGKGSSKAVALDSRFLVEIGAHYVGRVVKNAANSPKADELLQEAKAFGQRLREAGLGKASVPASPTKE